MGKDRKKTNRAFITQKEWSLYYGGLKRKQQQQGGAHDVVVPFDCCALTLAPFTTPVCTREGIVYELSAVEDFVRRHGVDPATGRRLGREGLTVLHFHRNSSGRYHCPVLYKEFTASTKIAAVRATGNVYSYEAVAELNLRAGNMRDLLDGTPFTREDVIVLQDPEHPERRDVGGFYYYRALREEKRGRNSNNGEEGEESCGTIVGSRATEKVLREYHAREQAAAAESRAIMGASLTSRGGRDGETAKTKTLSTNNDNNNNDNSNNNDNNNSNNNDDDEFYDHSSASGAQRVDASAPGFTSSVFSAARAREREAPSRGKETTRRGYVGVETSMGTLNVEVRCDAAPLASENFLGLCERGYYDGVCFHRNVPGFVVQGGDPTGTGRGGESVWGRGFRVEQGLRHDAAGVVAMANAGPGTNGSQFYVTYAAQPQLDGRHTVFGRVVGGMDVLRLMERVATDPATERPLAPITIARTVVYVNPFRELEQERRAAARAAEAARRRDEERWDAATCGAWYSDPGRMRGGTTSSGSGSGSESTAVGKYIKASEVNGVKRKMIIKDNKDNKDESVDDYLSRPISFSYEDAFSPPPDAKKAKKHLK